jgi:hypothetical protein
MREDRMVGHVARTAAIRNAYNILVGKPEGKRPLEKPGPRWEDNITVDLREIGCEGVDWSRLAQDRDQWRALCEHGNEISGSIKGGVFLD